MINTFFPLSIPENVKDEISKFNRVMGDEVFSLQKAFEESLREKYPDQYEKSALYLIAPFLDSWNGDDKIRLTQLLRIDNIVIATFEFLDYSNTFALDLPGRGPMVVGVALRYVYPMGTDQKFWRPFSFQYNFNFRDYFSYVQKNGIKNTEEVLDRSFEDTFGVVGSDENSLQGSMNRLRHSMLLAQEILNAQIALALKNNIENPKE